MDEHLNYLLNYLMENKSVAIVLIVSLVIHLWGFNSLLISRRTDFSYSGHTTTWYEGSSLKIFLSFLGWIVGFAVILFIVLIGMKGTK